MIERYPTQEFLRSVYNYIPETGEITYRKRIAQCVHIGDKVGFLESNGYHRVYLKGTRYLIHVLIWIYMTGVPPKNQIDHKNNIRSDNRWSNLREGTHSANQWNKKLQKNNTTGIKGISKKVSSSGQIHYTAAVRANKKCYTRSLSLISGRTEESILLYLSQWAQEIRDYYHKEFRNDGNDN